MTLKELTKQESGIIIYEGNTVASVNWSGYDGMPVLSPFGLGMISWPEEEGYFDGAESRRVDDIRDVLPGSVWLADEVDEDGTHVADTDLDIVDGAEDIIILFLGCEEQETRFSHRPAYNLEDKTAGTVYTLKDGVVIIAPDGWN